MDINKEAEKKAIILILIISGVIIIGVFVINFLFDSLAVPSTPLLTSENSITSGNGALQSIKERLAKNETFQNLNKYGDWPLDTSVFAKGHANPFESAAQK